ncbi:unnamed protein product [Dibothriocephalus latus]|uniref:PWI domain-containing protein n=1 Tax=Dibothriocephalus latus TaxID=60516 RepID=A0A3P7P2R2_DIBLA|nr:unnamed protein product [Dibothriocephalus latus]
MLNDSAKLFALTAQVQTKILGLQTRKRSFSRVWSSVTISTRRYAFWLLPHCQVDMTKVNVESLRPWIVKRITELLTYEDDILCDYVFNQLSEQVVNLGNHFVRINICHPDPKEIQINMTGFLLSKNARIFISELWDLLLSAMSTPGGVPAVFLEAKKVELSQKQVFNVCFVCVSLFRTNHC